MTNGWCALSKHVACPGYCVAVGYPPCDCWCHRPEQQPPLFPGGMR